MLRLSAFLSASLLVASLAATGQNTATPPAQAPAKAPAAAAKTPAPGGGPDKVWVNTSSKAYHCPGDRFYGTTKNGRYMTEPEAKAAGAHGPRGKDCFTK